MSWLLLAIAGLFEVGWAVGMKYSEGFTRPVPTALTVVALIISMVLLALAVRDLPVGTAYAVWTGIGAAGTAILGMWLFDESRDPVRLICLSLVVVGVLGLKFAAD
ncbi:MAG: quaternary ammonium compound efflux SMR transporter SugE [Blastocatellia bacterium]|nr:quaternary ammonium compound efflux SMR transporter SugE [Blastocatellia bacterium]MBK6427897.1 quaternary ammonium compound efflux SMR transporter SugE [Blastocatellia bacterium]